MGNQFISAVAADLYTHVLKNIIAEAPGRSLGKKILQPSACLWRVSGQSSSGRSLRHPLDLLRIRLD